MKRPVRGITQYAGKPYIVIVDTLDTNENPNRVTMMASLFQFTSNNSWFALTSHTHTDGGTGGGGNIYAGNNISLSVNLLSTTVSAIGLQATSATSNITANALNTSERSNYFYTSNNTFLTTAALSNHTHDYQSSGAYLTTAMASQNTSLFQYTSNTSAVTSLAFPSANTTKFAGIGTSATNASITLNSNGLQVSVAAPSAATENNWISLAGNVASNSSASGSTILWSAGSNITLAATNGSVVQIIGGAGGDTANAMNTSERDNYFYSSNNTFITTAAVSNHTHSDLYQSTGAYLTTAAQSVHTHDYQSTGAYLTTAALSQNTSNYMGVNTAITGASMTGNTSGISLNIPQGSLYLNDSNGITFGSSVSSISTSITASYNSTQFLTTAALSNHTHSDYATSILSGTFQTLGAYLTTAAESIHTHNYQSTGAYLTTAAISDHTHSNLYQSIGAYLTTAAQSNHTHSNLYLPLGNSTDYATSVLSGSFQTLGNYLTTAMASNAGSNFVPIGNSTQWATSILDDSLMALSYSSAFQTATLATKFLTTAANSTHSHGNPTLSLINLSGATASASNGLTVSLTGPVHGGVYFMDSYSHSWVSSVGTGTNSTGAGYSLNTSIYVRSV